MSARLGGKKTLDHVRQERSALAGRRIDRGHLLPPHSFLALVLLPLLTGLSALAYWIAPDPVWIAGIYDAADYDDAASAITDTNMIGAHARPAVHESMKIIVGFAALVAERISLSTAASALRPRSPPFV